MDANPFTPSFGGMPEYFVGRTELIERVRHALHDQRSPDFALFMTGCRGSGKTALLERLSSLAREERWLVIDVHSSHAASSIMDGLLSMGIMGKVRLTPSVSLPGGVQIEGKSEGAVDDNNGPKLVDELTRAYEKLRGYRGIFITIDEVQKIPKSDMEEVCAAVQMTRRKGLPICLMLAGLPGSKELVASYEGCTFMQRVEDVHIGGLLVDETTKAFGILLRLVPSITVSDDVVWSLSAMSQGYPYLIQLVGYCFVEHVGQLYPVGLVHPSAEDAKAVEDDVYVTYRQNVLEPSTRGVRREAANYLRAMARVQDDEGYVRTADVARELGKEPKQLSTCRSSLIRRRLVLPVGYGKVCFGLPYLTRFALETAEPRTVDLSGRWVPR